MTEKEVNDSLDLQGVLCPLNFVKAKLKLEDMEPGDILELIIDDEEGATNVPRSLKNEGHQILSLENRGNTFRMLVKKSRKKD